MQDVKMDLYMNTMVGEGVWSNKSNLRFHMDSLFNNLSFESKRVLDIGGGSGLISFYAACKNAKEVICLEPQAQGSFAGVNDNFKMLSNILKLDTVKLISETIQTFICKNESFDIIVLHNSINHLDETACQTLLQTDDSQKIYKYLFTKINNLSAHNAKLIVADCSRYNLFQLLHVRNPFTPSIEWDKHQTPHVWSKLLRDVGFINPQIHWSTFNRFQKLGKVFLSNKYASYLLTSHFCLTMEKP